MKILVVEDEILIQKSLQIFLQKRGALVDVSSSGKKAIEMIKEFNYDRVVCDLMLQDITGFDVIEEAKSKYSLEQISDLFVIITAYSSEQVLEKARSYNCIVLNKPFDSMDKALGVMMKSRPNHE
ncbi:MAG: response regulator [Bacteriovoracaceae bacterium]|nr:response regulator [Bacteriovoracaceae bacterium]